MRAHEFVTEKKRKRKPRWAAYGPGPYGGYGYLTGYSGVIGSEGGAVGEGELVNFPNLFQAKGLAQELVKVIRNADDPDRGIKFNKFYVELEKIGFKPLLQSGQLYLKHIQTNKTIPLNIREDAVSDLEKDLINPKSYDAIDHMMQTIAKKYKITPQELHDKFVKKHGVIPDRYSPKNKKDIVDAIKDFMPLAIRFLKLKSLPKITFVKNVQSKHDQPTFGVYHHDGDKKIELDIDQRHPIDIIRTLAHELVHYQQDLKGKLSDKSWHTGSPTENEAHDQAGIMMRMFDKQYPQYLKMQAVELSETAIRPVRQPLVQPVNKVTKDPIRTRYGDVARHDDPAPRQDYKKPKNQNEPDAMLKQIQIARKLGDSVEENFADGKKPGRKGLAKRSGVNCKASVTSLRKTAKNSTGEKRRMAHWCANMKSGRNK